MGIRKDLFDHLGDTLNDEDNIVLVGIYSISSYGIRCLIINLSTTEMKQDIIGHPLDSLNFFISHRTNIWVMTCIQNPTKHKHIDPHHSHSPDVHIYNIKDREKEGK